METGRAFLTDREREILSGEADVKDNYRYKVESTVRNRIDKLERDFAVIRENYPEMYAEISEIVQENE